MIVIAAEGVQQMLVESEPDHYYEPPRVRHLGWVGVRLDKKLKWTAISSLLEAAYLEVAPKIKTRSTGKSASRRPS